MDDAVIWMRIVERLCVVLGGFTSLLLGYFLLIRGAIGNTSFLAEGPGVRVRLLNASPGLVLSLFGSLLFGFTAFNTISIRDIGGDDSNTELTFASPDLDLGSVPPRDTAGLLRQLDALADQVAKHETTSTGLESSLANLMWFVTLVCWEKYEEDMILGLKAKDKRTEREQAMLSALENKRKELDQIHKKWVAKKGAVP